MNFMQNDFDKLINFLNSENFIGDDNISILSDLLGKTGKEFVFEFGDEKALHVMCKPPYKIKVNEKDIFCDAIVLSDKENKLFVQNRGGFDLESKCQLKKITHFGFVINNMKNIFHNNNINLEVNPTSFFFSLKNNELDDILTCEHKSFEKNEKDMYVGWVAIKTKRNVLSFYNTMKFVNSFETIKFVREKCNYREKTGSTKYNTDEISEFIRELYNYFKLEKLYFYFRKDFPIDSDSTSPITSSMYFGVEL